jgi:ubiquinone/menaquinone biosynthesis C-methylase UbiE
LNEQAGVPPYPVGQGVPGDIVPAREGYDRWSVVYDGDANPLFTLEEPEVERMIGDVRGLRIADVGAGTGRHSVRLANAGANVIALDFSSGMLRQARVKLGADRFSFVIADCAAQLPLQDGAFDRVVCTLLADHVRSLDLLVSELARICSKDGFIVLTTVHPTMHLLGVRARFNDPKTDKKIYPKSYDHSIPSFVMAVERAGLRFHELNEHFITEQLVRTNPRAAQAVGWPLLLAMKLARPQYF